MLQLFPPTQSRTRSIVYWIATALLAFGLLMGGIADVSRAQPIMEGMAKLGYPAYFPLIIGVGKLLNALLSALSDGTNEVFPDAMARNLWDAFRGDVIAATHQFASPTPQPADH